MLVFVLGIAGQLFMETYSIFSLLMSFAANIYFYIKNRKINLASIVYSAACIIGSVIMFTNGIYLKVLSGDDVYQTSSISGEMTSDIIWDTAEKFFDVVSFYFLVSCLPVIILILSFAAGIIKNSSVKVKKAVKRLSLAFAAIVTVFVSALLISGAYDKLRTVSGFILIYLVALCLILTKNFHSKKSRIITNSYYLMIAVLCAPLIVVSPVGHRCFCLPSFIMLLILREFYLEYKTIKNAPEKTSWIKKQK